MPTGGSAAAESGGRFGDVKMCSGQKKMSRYKTPNLCSGMGVVYSSTLLTICFCSTRCLLLVSMQISIQEAVQQEQEVQRLQDGARRAGGKVQGRLAQAVREVGTIAAAQRRKSAEGSAARLHSGQLLAGGVALGDGLSV